MGGKCDYCDFYSVPVNEKNDYGLMDSFVNTVIEDAADQLVFFDIKHVPSVYIGGGTPSALGVTLMERLLAGLTALIKPLYSACVSYPEFTVEANPETVNEAFLQACIKGGVNRISLGIQTFHEPSLHAVHRGNGLTNECITRGLALTAEYFPNAFSADLITGLPLQTMDILENDIHRLMAFNPAHVSLYSLILEPETPLGKKAAEHGAVQLSLPCSDDADSLWIAGRDMLINNSLAQYEVSNFALPGKTCTHNIRYWRMENWIGAGPVASGTIIDETAGTRHPEVAARRYTYPADIETWLAAPRPRIRSANTEKLSRANLIRESLLMGFRYREGPDILGFKHRFGCSIADCIPHSIARWSERGFFETVRPDRLAPSWDGLLFLNGFLADSFAELDGKDL
ncbi:MAG: coproporphyrinogen III oxidase family protein [Treponema sp.]|nr:coproporphyrinogen III oxidase family protein [Treponema sp.]